MLVTVAVYSEVTDTLLSLMMLCSFALSFLSFYFPTKVYDLFSLD